MSDEEFFKDLATFIGWIACGAAFVWLTSRLPIQGDPATRSIADQFDLQLECETIDK